MITRGPYSLITGQHGPAEKREKMNEWLKAQAAYAEDAFEKAERAEELSDYDALKTAERHYWDGYRDAANAALLQAQKTAVN